MKIGIDESYTSRYGFRAGLERMKSQGYECLDFQHFVNTETPLFQASDSEFEREVESYRKMAEETGIEIFQSHGPWRWPPRDFSPEDRAERFEKMSKSIYGTALLGCKYFIIHPIMPFGDNQDPDPTALWDMNLEFMGRLEQVARRNQVVICYENMPMKALSNSKPDAILRFAKEIDSPYFKVCLDTGHCAVFGESPAEAVRLIGKDYLATLHIHDNNGHGDLHWIPYTGVIDWEDFAKALREIGYEGCASLETGVPGRIPDCARESFELGLFAMIRHIAGRD